VTLADLVPLRTIALEPRQVETAALEGALTPS
jgi:hypothetical protein